MAKHEKLIRKTAIRALSGEGAHVGSSNVFEALDWKLAGVRPAGAPHSLFEILNHLVYWQNWVESWLAGKNPPIPEHAPGGWPGKAVPTSKKEWDSTVKKFSKGLDSLEHASGEADLLAKRAKKCPLEMLQAIASHNSYHLGQATLLRQMLGAWPPPSGGLTW